MSSSISPTHLPQPRTRTHLPKRTVSIIGTGSYVPERVLTNGELEKMVETSDEWIVSRTGIKERRIAAADEATSDMAAKAAQKALEDAGITAEEIDLIIVATVTPDMFFPATACFVQTKIGATRAACFDVSAACSGFLYALEIAQQFITSHTYETILVIGAEKLSCIIDWTDRNTCVLFGDGAGAAILRHRGGSHGVIATQMGSDGKYAEILNIPGGGCKHPLTKENADQRLNTIKMNGKETYKQAVNAMLTAANTVLAASNLKAEDLACIIPHQANIRIIEAIAGRMNLPLERFMVNLDRFGNTSAAAVAIALDEANRSGRMKEGDYILLVVFGGWAHLGQFRDSVVTPVLTDTHAHLDFPNFTEDLEGVLARAAEAGVHRLVTIGTSVEGSHRAVALAEAHPQVWAVIGIHPNEADEAPEHFVEELRTLARCHKVVALGEAGLDYHWLPSVAATRERKPVGEIAALAEEDARLKVRQAAVFRAQLTLARELGLNLVIHQRSAWEDTVAILREFPGTPQCVFHCFGESLARAEEIFALGHLVSFTGIVTFKNGRVVQEVARTIAPERFMVETDSPYLSPEPFRGQRCEPARVRRTAEFIAELRGVPLKELAEQTEAVANRFYHFVRK